MVIDSQHREEYGSWLASYALAIICFLPGIWWGLALIRRSVAALVLSNGFVVVAFFGHILLQDDGFILLCALLFPATILVERNLALFNVQPAYYARLRLHLSSVASISLVMAAWLVTRVW
jgi:hypothetical protein